MARKKILSKEDENVIAYLYNNRNLSLNNIADAFGISIRTLIRNGSYKLKFSKSKSTKLEKGPSAAKKIPVKDVTTKIQFIFQEIYDYCNMRHVEFHSTDTVFNNLLTKSLKGYPNWKKLRTKYGYTLKDIKEILMKNKEKGKENVDINVLKQ